MKKLIIAFVLTFIFVGTSVTPTVVQAKGVVEDGDATIGGGSKKKSTPTPKKIYTPAPTKRVYTPTPTPKVYTPTSTPKKKTKKKSKKKSTKKTDKKKTTPSPTKKITPTVKPSPTVTPKETVTPQATKTTSPSAIVVVEEPNKKSEAPKIKPKSQKKLKISGKTRLLVSATTGYSLSFILALIFIKIKH